VEESDSLHDKELSSTLRSVGVITIAITKVKSYRVIPEWEWKGTVRSGLLEVGPISEETVKGDAPSHKTRYGPVILSG
jgi:hypothetical protein